MTAALDRIGGETEYDRAVVLAEALGVRVVATTRERLLNRYSVSASAVLITRSRRGWRSTLGMDAEFDLQPGESGIYLTETRQGDTLAVLHELGHALLHKDSNRRTMEYHLIQAQEVEAWEYARDTLGRPFTAAERRDITTCLYGYGVSMRTMRERLFA